MIPVREFHHPGGDRRQQGSANSLAPKFVTDEEILKEDAWTLKREWQSKKSA
jgi:hypothetical protein